MLTVECRDQTLIARLAGELDLQVADALRAELDKALDDTGAVNLVFNLENVSFVDSSCLGVILGRYKRVSGKRGSMAFAAVPPRVRRVLEFSGLLRISKEFPTEEAALGNIGKEVG